MATAIVGVMLVAALSTTAAIANGRAVISDKLKAVHLAEELMQVARSRAFCDPVSPSFGLEPGENPTDPETFDDVDDFRSFVDSPITNLNRQTRAGYAGWSRSVSVVYVEATSPNTATPLETGVKKIIVTVRRDNAILLTLESLRTQAWDLKSP
jgi:type II secretory pathway pseudopilin PulG